MIVESISRAEATERAAASVPTGIYLVEHESMTKGVGLIFGFLALYNFAMAIALLSSNNPTSQVVYALLWIGGNQIGAFLVIAGRRRTYEVRRFDMAEDQ
jgi:hypothetical protein